MSDARRQDTLAPYEAIMAHAERELELAGQGEIARLAEQTGRWQELIDACPSSPPAEAAGLLELATLMHERVRVELLRLRESLLVDLGTVRQARAAAAGYARQAGPVLRVERSA
jgi:hypothetical protein